MKLYNVKSIGYIILALLQYTGTATAQTNLSIGARAGVARHTEYEMPMLCTGIQNQTVLDKDIFARYRLKNWAFEISIGSFKYGYIPTTTKWSHGPPEITRVNTLQTKYATTAQVNTTPKCISKASKGIIQNFTGLTTAIVRAREQFSFASESAADYPEIITDNRTNIYVGLSNTTNIAITKRINAMANASIITNPFGFSVEYYSPAFPYNGTLISFTIGASYNIN